MTLSRFFIDRPIFAWVIGLIIMLVGAVSITRMPIAQYPSIAPRRSPFPLCIPARLPRR